MAARVDDKINGCTFLWKIVNISHCWLKKGERLISPLFTADALGGTKWSLRFYPRDDKIYLRRVEGCIGFAFGIINVNYLIAILDKDGEFLTVTPPTNGGFETSTSHLCNIMTTRENISITERKVLFPEDTMTIQCTLWEPNETLNKSQHVSARTVFQVNRKSFVWKMNNFSSFKPGMRNKFKNDMIDFDLVLNKIHDTGNKLDLDIISFNESLKYFSIKISIITSEREYEECGGHEYYADDLQIGILYTLLFTKKLMENKSRYLPDDVLSLDCEYVSSNGSFQHENCCYGTISPKITKGVSEKRQEHYVEKEKYQNYLVLANDLKSMYNDEVFSDTELRTSTKTFPAHKLILSARSPVFRRMFSNNMKENNCGRIDISDLEDDTVHRMLLYIYSDSLEDLQLEGACQLYVAADKYEILSLRSRCSSILKDNLCVTGACEVLTLADRHRDEDLKSTVQDFILGHEEVFRSQDWKDLMATNLQLAADVMYRNCTQVRMSQHNI